MVMQRHSSTEPVGSVVLRLQDCILAALLAARRVRILSQDPLNHVVYASRNREVNS
jgi:hypothetical protein